eukprot:14507211-Alexandrium_andersonii.AAC.1
MLSYASEAKAPAPIPSQPAHLDLHGPCTHRTAYGRRTVAARTAGSSTTLVHGSHKPARSPSNNQSAV